ncbi:HAD hydrolase family protein, partial [Klebsiella variicola]|uniref:HAD hydrolase family protein n=1 Tax=Klebsiella variicola TaxID=244366 RepID=UPI0013D4390C
EDMTMGSLAFDLPADVVEKFLRVRFVVMDVDGTIRSSDDSTAEAVSQILGRLEKVGIGWSFATGRTIAGLHG